MDNCILKMTGITKTFPGVKALDKVNLNVYAGKIMALVGENGAGKSTLMKIMTGIYKLDEGTIEYMGKEVEFKNTKQANDLGIAIIHQDLNMLSYMKVYENIFLGREIRYKSGRLNKKKMIEESKVYLDSIKADINPCEEVRILSVAKQQMVEIAKVLSIQTNIIVMDEPTDSLPDNDVENLFRIMRELREKGKGIVYISHRLKEIFEICDKVTIFRDGKFIHEGNVSEVDESAMIKMMVGRSLNEQFPHVEYSSSKTIFEVDNVTNKYVKDISFKLLDGEILGIVGLVGAGRTELGKTLYGVLSKEKGNISMENIQINPKSPREAIDAGIYYISEDRKGDGLVLGLSVAENITMASLKKLIKNTKINKKKEKEICSEYKDKLQIKTPNLTQKVKFLSGGNQQKVAIAKGLMTEPKVLIMDEPTRGVDVGAKKEIYELMNKQKQAGKSIIMISSEMPEILGMSDRILVMNEGRVKGELSREEVTQEKIMELVLR